MGPSTWCRASPGAEQINALGLCVGGTILGNALAVMQRRGQEPVASATFLTRSSTLPTPASGRCSLTRRSCSSAKCRWAKAADEGAGPGHPTFSFCAPTTWSGTTWWATTSKRNAAPFDLLYWNSDSTNLPVPFYAWYCAISIWKTIWSAGRCSPCAAKLDLEGRPAGLHLRLARRPHRAHQRRVCVHPVCCPAKRFVMGPQVISRASSTHPPRTSAATGFATTASSPPRSSNGLTGHRASGQLVDRLVRELAEEPCGQADCRPKTYGKAPSSRPLSPRLALR